MTNKEWNEGIEYLQNSEEGCWIKNGRAEVVVVNMVGGRYTCYKDDEFVKLVETEVEAMLFLKGE